MGKMQAISLFPTAVGRFDFPREFTKKELKFVKELEKSKNAGNWRSVDSYVLRHKKMKGIRNFIQDAVENYFKLLYKPIDGIDIYLTQSWFNYADFSEWHHKHAHPNSYFSGVLYLNGDEQRDSITFHKPEYRQITVEYTEFTYHNSNSWTLPAKTGVMYVFPSGLHHSVNPVSADAQRISLAFNTFLKGPLGSYQTLTELILE
jgi:uncharacterized protein (TIGR02466 family)